MIKLLFNTSNNDISSVEIKELLGFTDANISFKNMLSEFITSSKEVKKIIGPTAYDHIAALYTAGLTDGQFTVNLAEFNSFLVRSTRYPIAALAYSIYAPTNDLRHGNDGRTVVAGENTKQPWQWQIDNDNKAQEKRYYKGIDDLIEMLDDSKPEGYAAMNDAAKQATIYYKWINSDNYKELKSVFVNTVDDFNKVFIIESRLLLLKLTSALKECEKFEIAPRIGKEKYDALKAAAPTDAKDIELLQLIKNACVYYSLAWAIPRMSATIFPEGVLQFQISDRQSTTAKKPVLGNEHEYARQAFADSAKSNLLAIEQLLAPAPVVDAELKPIDLDRCQEDKFFSAT